MKLTPEELLEAKVQLMKLHPVLTTEEIKLMRKYPRHTLEQAKYIDSATGAQMTPGQNPGYVSGFDKLIAQEKWDKPLSGDHT